MLSVMVILLSEMNSYRMRVAIAVLSPSSAPCLVFALRPENKESALLLSWRGRYRRIRTGFPPFIDCAVYEPLQLVLEILLGRVLAGFSTWRHTGLRDQRPQMLQSRQANAKRTESRTKRTFIGNTGGITEAAAMTEGLDGGVLVTERLHVCILPS